LSAYFYGYLTTQIAGGYASLIFGAKITLAVAIFIGSLFTLLAPIAAQYSWIALVACRFLTGFAHVNTQLFMLKFYLGVDLNSLNRALFGHQ